MQITQKPKDMFLITPATLSDFLIFIAKMHSAARYPSKPAMGKRFDAEVRIFINPNSLKYSLARVGKGSERKAKPSAKFNTGPPKAKKNSSL